MRYLFDPYELDLDTGWLLGPGGEVRLRPQAFDLLRVLVASSPRVLTKDELLDEVWGREFVSPSSLKQAVSELRHALADEAVRPTYIETVHRRGYRFRAPVERIEDGSLPGEGGAGAAVPAVPRSATIPGRGLRRAAPWLAGLGLLIASAVLVAVFFPRPVPASGRPAVAVIDFQNLSERADDAWIGAALRELVSLDLVTGGRLRPIPGETVARMETDLELSGLVPSRSSLEQIQRYCGADFVVRGSFLATDGGEDRLEVQMLALDTRHGEARAAVHSAGPRSDLVPLTQRLARQLWTELGHGSAEGASGLAQALPRQRRALRLYAEGRERLRLRDLVGALEPLQAAAELDPGSALVHAALSRTWDALGFDARAVAAAERAVALAAELPPALRLRLEAERYRVQGAWAEAARVYETLWRLDDGDPEVGVALVEARLEHGEHAAAADDLETLRRRLGDDPRVDLLASELAYARADYAAASRFGAAAIERGEAIGAGSLVAQAERQVGWASLQAGDTGAALAAFRRSAERSWAAGDRGGAASARSAEAMALQELGRVGAAEALLRGALDVFRELGDRRREARALNNLASITAAQGDIEGVAGWLGRALEIKREVGDVSGQATTLVNLAELERHRGELASARRHLDQALALGPGLEGQARALALRSHADLLAAEGRTDAARSAYGEALELFRAMGSTPWEARLHRRIGLLAFDLGDAGDALEHLGRSLDLFAELGHPADANASRLALARVRWAATCDTEEARRELGSLLALAEGQTESAAASLRAEAQMLLGDVALTLGESRRARERYEIGLEVARSVGYAQAEIEIRSALLLLDLDAGRPAAQVLAELGRLEDLAERQATAPERLRVRAAAARVLAAAGRCGEARSRVAEAEAGGVSVRPHERLAAGLDLARALAVCGAAEEAAARHQEIVVEARRLGYACLERRAGDGAW